MLFIKVVLKAASNLFRCTFFHCFKLAFFSFVVGNILCSVSTFYIHLSWGAAVPRDSWNSKTAGGMIALCVGLSLILVASVVKLLIDTNKQPLI